ncbi:transcription elongation factor GreA [Geobacter sp. OR-1]|uniref:GreA/GreB family elongation factor n=1 Tax=Geobacter sp. OR-1 TaxID=1266765 RepID=UPI000543867B|nr:GreA/GreB family elongation factor [Geobacter sp. OR-1]GAM10411.1 transcription elongation factor GreA [Geobacter sp. OR-1]
MTERIVKAELLKKIIAQLSHDLDVLFTAAKTAHEASTHEENQPDNKYDTLALEASYVAQGQANRAHELRKSIEIYRQLKPHGSNVETVRLTSLVTLEDPDGKQRTLFICPIEGGLKIEYQDQEIVVITPGSPLGRELLGKTVGDAVEIETGNSRTEYEIVEIC